MTRLPGALCAFAACAVAGAARAARLRDREARLESWDAALRRMKAAAETGALPLPRILRSAGGNATLLTGAEMLEKDPGMEPDAWLAALPKEEKLPPDIRALLREALLSLFDYPARRQAQGLEKCIAELAPLRRREKEKNEKGAALALRLGVLAGAALFILLC